mmetsp:Transcript_52683/g.92484  ORF Transcript_52683/g.92484 Transcript_52683/m.92484 type:complete len:141 (-) Transcript_52683:446-868(-)
MYWGAKAWSQQPPQQPPKQKPSDHRENLTPPDNHINRSCSTSTATKQPPQAQLPDNTPPQPLHDSTPPQPPDSHNNHRAPTTMTARTVGRPPRNLPGKHSDKPTVTPTSTRQPPRWPLNDRLNNHPTKPTTTIPMLVRQT